MSQLLTPVYTIQKISSTSTPASWESIDAIARQLGEGYIVLWQHHAIFTGVVEGKVTWLNDAQPVIGDEHMVRVRAFNETQEYHFWRSNGKIQGRLRTDAQAGDQEVVDTQMMLRSVVGKALRKAHPDLVSEDVALITRNYIAYDSATQQAGYVDSRFVKFQPFNPNNA
ncbi:MAG: CRISPR-associated protein Csx19 [Bacteroidia bacterium]|nr:CRISPR-associated protein Csx19 [Bacteroidia bacterium]